MIEPGGIRGVALMVAALMAMMGCGDDDRPGPGTDAGGSADAGGGGGDAGGTADAGGGPDSGPVLGCAEPGGPMCPTGQVCCSGVPYPMEGICQMDCPAVSDREQKLAFEPVDGDAVLGRLAELPITEWSYRREGTRVRHVGPMAQDFSAAFGLGDSDRHIHPVDSGGVVMAAVQALNRRVEALDRRNRALAEENDGLTERLHRLEASARGDRASRGQ